MSSVSKTEWAVEIDDRNLPLLAQVALDAMMLIDSGEPSAKEIKQLMKSDLGLTARVLRLSNSPIYAGRTETGTLEQAIVRLGLIELKRILIIAATGELLDPRNRWMKDLWRHSIAVAITSQWISSETKRGEPEECFLGGLLHDIGKLVIFQQCPQAYKTIVHQSEEEGARYHLVEQGKISPCGHDSIGALIAIKWGLHGGLVEVMNHHHRIETEELADMISPDLVLIVSVANLLVHQCGLDGSSPLEIDAMDSIPARLLGLDTDFGDQSQLILPNLVDDQRTAYS